MQAAALSGRRREEPQRVVPARSGMAYGGGCCSACSWGARGVLPSEVTSETGKGASRCSPGREAEGHSGRSDQSVQGGTWAKAAQ